MKEPKQSLLDKKPRKPSQKSGSESNTWRYLCLATCCCIYCCEGINVSIMAPFFPPYAQKLGLSETEIGFVQGIFDVSSFCSQFLVASVITPQTRKLYYVLGIFISAVCLFLFGYTGNENRPDWFFGLSLVVRAMMGFGASFVYASTIPMINSLFRKKRESLIPSLKQVWVFISGCGAMIGPPLGSALKSLGKTLWRRFLHVATAPHGTSHSSMMEEGKHPSHRGLWPTLMFFLFLSGPVSIGNEGYSLPFYANGGFQMFLTICLILTAPNQGHGNPTTKRKQVPKGQYFKFICSKTLLAMSIPGLAMFALAGYKDVAYSPHFEKDIGVDDDLIGYVFLAISATYLFSAPIWGLLIQNGYVIYSLMVAMYGGCTVMLFFFLPAVIPWLENLPFGIITLVINGLSISSLFGSVYLVYEKIAEREGFTDLEVNKLMVASWYSAVRAMGRTVGSLLIGGPILQFATFYYTCLGYFIVDVVLSILATGIAYNLGLFQRTYYSKPEADKFDLDGLSSGAESKISKIESQLEMSIKSMSSLEAI